LSQEALALEVLDAWKKQGGWIAHWLQAKASAKEDSRFAFAQELCYGTCRHLNWLDWNVKKALHGKVSGQVRTLLCLAGYATCLLNPDKPWVINEWVALAKKRWGLQISKLVNAVLRKWQREGLSKECDPWVLYSLPQKLWHQWVAQWGEELARQAALDSLRTPREWMRYRKPTEEAGVVFDGYYRELEDPNLREFLHSPEFTSGAVSLQNPASYLVVQLLNTPQGIILDACAAPGGKSALIRDVFPAAFLVSADKSPQRLLRVQDYSMRMSYQDLRPVVSDATSPAFKSEFDAILLDVPCSNAGVLARRVEARHHWEANLASLVELQQSILVAGAKLLRPGGVLVYSTCSPCTIETQAQIERFLESHPNFELEPAAQTLGKYGFTGPYLEIVPGNALGLDGFFAAKIKRKMH
jgi:16S rRNA (cytosine967-C5)-methyltransferase